MVVLLVLLLRNHFELTSDFKNINLSYQHIIIYIFTNGFSWRANAITPPFIFKQLCLIYPAFL
jgi:hypothetical protein